MGRRILFIAGLAIVTNVSVLPAQETPETRRSGPSFMSVRFATHGAHTLYGGYQFERWLVFVGMVQNVRTQYREAIVGAGATVAFPRVGRNLLLGLALADASDAPYVQWYALPSIRAGRMLLDGTVEGYVPLAQRGSEQLGATPLNLVYVWTRDLALGASYVGGGQRDVAPTHAIGPSLRLSIPSGTVAIDALRAVRGTRNEMRVTAIVSF